MRVMVIMAGGSGERFWPLSRRHRPKQFLPLGSANPLLVDTVERAATVVGEDQVYIVAGPHLMPAIAEMLPDLPKENLLVEPVGKNTAPCLAFAAGVIAGRHGEETVMGVLTSDHVIRDVAAFDRNVDLACEYAEKEGALMTLGITPTEPDTGFGYLEIGPALVEEGRGSVHKVQAFREKPDEETAKKYLADGNHLWNSGMFFWRIDSLLNAFAENCPSMADGARRIASCVDADDFDACVAEAFENWESNSIDYAVMEKAANVCAVPSQFDWDDVGTWTALARHHQPDERGNTTIGPCLTLDAHGCILQNSAGAVGDSTVIAALGVHDLVVVNTDDAVLVCHRDRVQDIKKVLAQLRENGHDQLT